MHGMCWHTQAAVERAKDRSACLIVLRTVLKAIGLYRTVCVASFIMLVGGCEPASPVRSSVEPYTTDSAEPSWVLTTAAKCPHQCVRESLAVACGRTDLDLETVLASPATEEVADLMARLRTAGQGRAVTVLEGSVAEVLDHAEPGDTGILVDAHGHVHVLLGSVEVDGQPRYQLMHGGADIALAAREACTDERFPRAWTIAGSDSEIALTVGRGRVSVSQLAHSFGHITPGETLTHTFTFTNNGGATIVFGKPHASCSCTTASGVEGRILLPGKSLDVPVTVKVMNQRSLRETAYLTLFEQESGATRRIAVLLLGSQSDYTSTSPAHLNFGRVVAGRSCSRRLRVKSNRNNPFRILDVSAGSIKVAWSEARSQLADDCVEHTVDVHLQVDEMSSGAHTVVGHILTTSSRTPDIPIPISFVVAPSVSIRPSVIVLGSVDIGQPQRRTIRLEAPNGEPVAVTLQNVTPDIAVVVQSNSNYAELELNVVLGAAGPWQGSISALVATSGQKEELITIKCVGIGRELRD